MAKLYLKFEQAVLKEVPLSQGVVTIGRLPDNLIHVDNLAVSGHHAKIYWDTDKYVIEDNNSLNGTYLNNRRISKSALKDEDVILIGKHTISFKDEWHEGPGAGVAAEKAGPALPKMEATMVLDTKKAKEMMAQAQAAQNAGAAAQAGGAGHAQQTVAETPVMPAKDRTGILTVLDGKTDHSSYNLTSKMSVIGKSDMASIKLKGFFAPNMAALINKRDNKYYIAASEAKIKVKINGQEIAGQKELNEGDVIEVAGIKMSFGYD
ncbi:MAG TPA: FHA domain-containing protein [Terriglobales bacterium]|nr:FHA domain-containing protein [Terriglobales bacterium]